MIKNTILSILTIILIASCTRETRLGAQAQVKFINASVNTDSAEVTFDGSLLIANTGFPKASGYAFVNVGTASIKISATYNSGITVQKTFSGVANLESNSNYTIVAADSILKMKTSIVKDEILTPATGKASIRFFHLIGNQASMSVDTSTTTSGATLFASRTFNDQSTNSSTANFVTVNAGTYTFKAKDATTGTAIFSKSITLESGRLYTIAATGAVGATVGTVQSQGFTVLLNN